MFSAKYTIEKETLSEDCYVTVKRDGKEIYVSLWVGQSDKEILTAAFHHALERGL